jgi:hypothetical protein
LGRLPDGRNFRGGLIPSRFQNVHLGGTAITSGTAQAGSLCHHLIAPWYEN